MAARTHNSLTFSWTASAQATGYDLYIATDSVAPTAQTAATISVGRVVTHLATGLSPSTSYNVYIRSKNAAGASAWSAAHVATTTAVPLTAPAVPTNFRRTSATGSSIAFGWTAAARAAGYDLYITTSETAPTRSTVPTVSIGAVTAYTREGLSGSTVYRAYIRAKNAAGVSAWTGVLNVSTGTPDQVPGVPANFNWSAVTTSSATFTWDATEHAAGYDLYIAQGATAPTSGTAPTISVGAQTTYTQTGLIASTTYYAYIRAKNNTGTSDWSAATTPTTSAPPTPLQIPPVPANFRVTETSSGSLSFAWSRSTDAAGYDIFVTTDDTAPVAITIPTAFVGNVLMHEHTGLDANTRYHCYIRAKNGAGGSAWSSVLFGTTAVTGIEAPGVPTGIGQTAASPTAIIASWGPTPRATGYDVYISDTAVVPEDDTVPTATVGEVVTDYTFTGLSPTAPSELFDDRYRIYVRAKNRGGNSAWSPAYRTTTHPAGSPSSPFSGQTFTGRIRRVSATSNSITVSIPASVDRAGVHEATGYDFFVTTSSSVEPAPATVPTASVDDPDIVDGRVIYEITGLEGNRQYHIFYRAKNTLGNTSWFPDRTQPGLLVHTPVPATVAPTAAPAAPAVVSYQYDSLHISWPRVNTTSTFLFTPQATPVTNYDLYVTTSATPPTAGTTPTVSLGDVTAYDMYGLSAGTLYRVYIRGKNSFGNSPWSAVAEVTTLAGAPPLVAVGATSFSQREALPTGDRPRRLYPPFIEAEWPTGNNYTRTDIYISADEAPPLPLTRPTESVATRTSPFMHRINSPGINSGTQYHIHIRGANAYGAGEWASAGTVTTEGMLRPDTPGDLRVTEATDSSITLSWTTVPRARRVANTPGEHDGHSAYDIALRFEGGQAPFYTAYSGGVGYQRETTQGTTWTRTFERVNAAHPITDRSYEFYIRSRNDSFSWSDWSDKVFIGHGVAALPTNLAGRAISNSRIDFTWTPSVGAYGYDLYVTDQVTPPTPATTPTATFGVTDEYALATGLSASTTYLCYLRARGRGGDSAWTAATTVTTLADLPVPAVPENFTADFLALAFDKIPFMWDASPGATGYDLYFTTSASVPTAQTTPTVSVAAVTEYIRTGLTASTTYNAFIRAKNAGGTSAWSSAVRVLTFPPPRIPAAPIAFASALDTHNSITYTWQDGETTSARLAREYDLYITTGTEVPHSGTLATATVGEVFTYTATGLSARTTYRAYIRAKNVTGASHWSDVVAVTTAGAPPAGAPTNVRVTDRFTQRGGRQDYLTLRWDAVSGATSYEYFVGFGTDNTPRDAPGQVFNVGNYLHVARGPTLSTSIVNYAVRAVIGTTKGNWSSVLTVQGSASLGEPFNFSVTRFTHNSITYEWSAATRATGYDLYISSRLSTQPGRNQRPSASFDARTTYTATGLAENTRYWAFLRARSDQVVGEWSNAAQARTQRQIIRDVAPPLATPTGFAPTAVGATSIAFGWSAVTDATGYDLYVTTSRREPTIDTAATASVGAVTTGTATGLTAGTTYLAYIRARSATQTSAWTAAQKVATPTAATLASVPPRPTGLRVTDVPVRGAAFAWDALPAVTGYDIYVTLAATPPTAETTPTASPTATTYTARGLELSRTYYVYVRAKNSNGAGPWTSARDFRPGFPGRQAPNAPVVTASNITRNSIRYRAPVPSRGLKVPIFYDIYYGPRNLPEPTSLTVPTVTVYVGLDVFSPTLDYTLTDLAAGTRYRAFFRARNSGGASDWTSGLDTTTAAATSAPSIPRNFELLSYSHNSITYEWDASPRATGYEFIINTRGQQPRGDARATDFTGADNLRYTKTGLQPGTRYQAYLRASNRAGRSLYFVPPVVVTTAAAPAIPPVPTNFARSSSTTTSITYGWTAAPRATGYDLYITTSATVPTAQTAATVQLGRTTAHTQRGLVANTQYRAYIRAKNDTGASAWSAVLSATTPVAVPSAAPTSFVRSSATHNSITFGWTTRVDATGYDLYITTSAALPTAQTAATASVSGGTTGTYTRTGLSASTQYRAYIRATNSAGSGPWSAVLLASTTALPAAPPVPTNFARTSVSSTSISYSWTAAARATGYDLYIATTATAPTAQTAPTISNVATTTYTRTGLLSGTTYWAYVRARNDGGTSAWTSLLSVRTLLAIPPVPTGLTRSQAHPTSMLIGWAAAARASAYDLYITTSSVAPTARTTPTASLGAVTSYTATGLTASTTYNVYIRAKNNGGASAWSAALSASTLAPLVAIPPVPLNFVRSSATTTSITFGWSAAPRAAGYDIYITTSATAPTASTTPTASVGIVTTYTRSSLATGTTYRAYIRAKNRTGASAWTSALSAATAPAAPLTPTGVTLTAVTQNSATFTWDASAGATGYDILTGTGPGSDRWLRNGVPSTEAPSASVGAVTTYNVTGLNAFTSQRFYIRAKNSSGTSAWTGRFYYVTEDSSWPVPAVPAANRITTISNTRNSITYTFPSVMTNTSFIDVYITTSATAPTASTTPTASFYHGWGLGTNVFTREGLTASTQYRAYFRARNHTSGASAWSAAVTATTIA